MLDHLRSESGGRVQNQLRAAEQGNLFAAGLRESSQWDIVTWASHTWVVRPLWNLFQHLF
jgi:hypothetical protein